VTRLEAYRRLVSAPRQTASDGKIGRRVCRDAKGDFSKPDGREKLSAVYRLLNFTKRKAS
jgi:hypothetical protein